MARYKKRTYEIHSNGTVETFTDEDKVLSFLLNRARDVTALYVITGGGRRVLSPLTKELNKPLDLYKFRHWMWMYQDRIKGISPDTARRMGIQQYLRGRVAPLDHSVRATRDELKFKRELADLKYAHKKLAEDNDRLRAENKQTLSLLNEAMKLHIKHWMVEQNGGPIASDQYRFATLWLPQPAVFKSVADVLASMHYFGTSGKDAVRDVWDRKYKKEPNSTSLYIAELNGDKLTLWWQGNYDALRYRISKFTG
jgi:hypothetical protein